MLQEERKEVSSTREQELARIADALKPKEWIEVRVARKKATVAFLDDISTIVWRRKSASTESGSIFAERRFPQFATALFLLMKRTIQEQGNLKGTEIPDSWILPFKWGGRRIYKCNRLSRLLGMHMPRHPEKKH